MRLGKKDLARAIMGFRDVAGIDPSWPGST